MLALGITMRAARLPVSEISNTHELWSVGRPLWVISMLPSSSTRTFWSPKRALAARSLVSSMTSVYVAELEVTIVSTVTPPMSVMLAVLESVARLMPSWFR